MDPPHPALSCRGRLVALLEHHDVVIVVGDTGTGKTTQLTACLVDDFHLVHPEAVAGRRPARIICTQPRRPAATKMAERVAREYGGILGDRVGFRIGRRGVVDEDGEARTGPEDCRKLSPRTRLEFVTDGILCGELLRGGVGVLGVEERRYDCVIFDEAHEQSMATDLALSAVRNKVLGGGRFGRVFDRSSSVDSFKTVVMSASINEQKLAEYFGGCPILRCDGAAHQVDIRYLPPSDPDSIYPFSNTNLCPALREILQTWEEGGRGEAGAGDVLVFLPGYKQIRKYIRSVGRLSKNVVAYPLHSKMSKREQDDAMDATKRDRAVMDKICGADVGVRRGEDDGGRDCGAEVVRKVVVATNISETSLTVPGIKFVIDYGMANRTTFDHFTRVKWIGPARISDASALQRRGRVGRTSPGTCYRMWSREQKLARFDPADLETSDIGRQLLQTVSICGGRLGLLESAPNPPSAEALALGLQRLQALGLIEQRQEGPGGGGQLSGDHRRKGERTGPETMENSNCEPPAAEVSAARGEGKMTARRSEEKVGRMSARHFFLRKTNGVSFNSNVFVMCHAST